MSRIAVLCLIAALIAGEEPRTAALTVRTVRPTIETWPVLVRASGEIAAWQEAAVAVATGGLRILELKAEIGDQVKAGQELAILDTSALCAQLAALEAEVEQAEAGLTTAAADARRAQDLRASGTLTEQQATQYLSSERSARGRLAAARAVLEVQRLALERARVTAPDDGVVIARNAVLGEVAQSGDGLFRIIRQGRLEWRAEVLAPDLPRIAPGQEATLALPGGGGVAGRVRSVDPVLSARTRTAIVRIDLPTGAARAGMFASGEIAAEAPSPATTIPAAALVVRDGRELVFEVGSADIVRERRVVIGRRRGDRIEVTSGLDPDARIVAAGGAFLGDGDRVTVAP